MQKNQIQHPETSSRLAVLMPGMGSIATTLIAGVYATRAGLGLPIGSYTQLGTLAPKEGEEGVPVRDLFGLPSLGQLVFGGWDIYADNAYEAASRAAVLEPALLDKLREPLSAIQPMPAAFDPELVSDLEVQQCKPGNDRHVWAQAVREDIRNFLREHGCARGVMLWCGSTERYRSLSPAHQSIEAFEQALQDSDPAITPSQIYAWAALREGMGFANATPNAVVTVPALRQLAASQGLPLAGEDLKTGQTLIKTSIASTLRLRHLGVAGWYSSNILGNRDGKVLRDEGSFRTKEISKKGVLDTILAGDEQPDLWGGLEHQVHINYYPPRGDNKESWDNIDLFGWLGYPMQLKVNFLCRDSILAAPLLLDLALWLDLASAHGASGVQEWLSFYFKAPAVPEGALPVHGVDDQFRMLQAQLRDFLRKAYAASPEVYAGGLAGA